MRRAWTKYRGLGGRWQAVIAALVAFTVIGAIGSATEKEPAATPTVAATGDVADGLPFAATSSTTAEIIRTTTTTAPTTTTAAPTTTAPPPTTAAPQPLVAPPPTAAPAASVYYANCTDAWNKGGAPVHRGDPGYRSGLDRDGDGTGCEEDPR